MIEGIMAKSVTVDDNDVINIDVDIIRSVDKIVITQTIVNDEQQN